MSYWGYVIEQLITDDERQKTARERARKRRLAGLSARSRTSRADGTTAAKSGRLAWPLLRPRH